MSIDLLHITCDVCDETTQEPYIECCECDTNICLECFASGKEISLHKNDHRYAVRKNDFPLFDNCNWTAKEESKLLMAITSCGYGNWEDISKFVSTRSKLECQEHYKKYYIENAQHKDLDLFPETDQSLFPKIVVPFIYSSEVSRDPPRNNHSDPYLAGYNAYRSEFELNYDHMAESMFNAETTYSENEDDDEDEEFMDALKVSQLNALNTRLRERQRRYNIIQTHGLIMPNKVMAWLQRFEKTLTRSKAEKMLPFMQFMTGLQFDALMETLNLEAELLQRISRLREYRRLGIKTLHSVKLYKQLKENHDKTLKEQRFNTLDMQSKFLTGSSNQCSLQLKRMKEGFKKVKPVTPLDIVDLPRYHVLNDYEKKLCSTIRIIPEIYLDIKDQLIAECSKVGHLRLLDARRIVKIDVNKTRKIYDYLVSEGFIKSK